MIIKLWHLTGPYSHSDFEWLTLSQLQVQVTEPETVEFDLAGGISGRVIVADAKVNICTTSKHEETWLLLKYSNRARLLAQPSDYMLELVVI